MLRTLRVYEVARTSAASQRTGAALLAKLAAALDVSLCLVDPADGRPLLTGGGRLPDSVRQALVTAFARRQEPAPAILPLRSVDGRTAMALALPGYRRATLVAVDLSEHPPDLAVLHHVAALAALEVARRDADRQREGAVGAALLARLLDGRIDAESAWERLREWGLPTPPWVLAALDYGEGHDDVGHLLADGEIAHLLLVREDLQLVLAADDPRFAATIQSAAQPCGLSDRVDTTTRIGEAAREARWALELARQHSGSVERYGALETVAFMPATVGEAQILVRGILGPLLDWDRDHKTDFTGSLREFLAQNRSWQRSAERLHVHKQTLIYRMNRVTELTGKRLDRTADIVTLWLALEALDRLHIPGQPDRL